MIILWVGLAFSAKVILVLLATVFPVVLNVRQGSKDVSASLYRLSDAFCLSWFARLRKVLLPSILPYVASGLRLALGRAIGTMLVAEMTTAAGGLGELMIAYSRLFQTDRMLAPTVVLVVLGIGLTSILKYGERRLLWWSMASSREAR
jgi:NitT/TauT family transport system permease protein